MKFLVLASLLVLVGAGCAGATPANDQEEAQNNVAQEQQDEQNEESNDDAAENAEDENNENTDDGSESAVETDESSVSNDSQETDDTDTASNDTTVDNSNEPTESGSDPAVSPVTYAFANGSRVEYVVQKGWISRPTEAVVGKNNSVTGKTTFDPAENVLQEVSLTVDSQAFSSGSGGRDGHVRRMLSGPITISLPSPQNVGQGTFEKSMAFDLTINGVAKRVLFTVNGDARVDGLTASGSATIDMTQFNIEPPSIAGVYSVEKDMQIRFNLVADVQ